MPRVVLRHRVDDAGLARLAAPRRGLVAEEPDGDGAWIAAEGPVRTYRRTLDVSPADDGTHDVVEELDLTLAIPFFAPLFVHPVRAALATESRRLAAGEPLPDAQPWWAPPDRVDRRAATVLALLSVLSLVGGYLGTLITQTITFAVDRFDGDRADQSFVLAAVRVGVLLALVIAAASDRRGRRTLLLGTATAAIALAATGALAPNLLWLGTSQTIARGLSTALALLVGIVAAEELPAGSRAYGVSVMALAAGLGAGMCVWVLPLADLGPDAWRLLYLIPLLALPLLVRVARLLPETRRFAVHRGEAPAAVDRGRLGLLAVSGFLASMFLAPASQFQNEFLRTERGFSAARISAFTLLTTTPAGIGVAVGGRLADVRGRRGIAAIGLVGGAGFTLVSFLVPGWPMWAASAVGAVIAAATVPALGVYGPELFPTSGRGRANGIITLVGVAGSSAGLLVVGQLSDPLGGIGGALAVLLAGPLALAVLVLARYPETAHKELEELNPADAPAGRSTPPPPD
ncbi:MFS transporter [Actinomarinicola tropica]|uniref:MFS transporter n=1 Tax=Actinomarinicola tropica TaxID=2789776 RepID=A0A5Q2RG44_9ACTN|nr:MFS transporter [Actinomarinicola tropica]QGG94614.1 MFS transporter [Actinomarinicola tropica]